MKRVNPDHTCINRSIAREKKRDLKQKKIETNENDGDLKQKSLWLYRSEPKPQKKLKK